MVAISIVVSIELPEHDVVKLDNGEKIQYCHRNISTTGTWGNEFQLGFCDTSFWKMTGIIKLIIYV